MVTQRQAARERPRTGVVGIVRLFTAAAVFVAAAQAAGTQSRAVIVGDADGVSLERSGPTAGAEDDVASWWRSFDRAVPLLSESRRLLETRHRLWRLARHERCALALESLERVDRRTLVAGAPYLEALEVHVVLAALADGVRACRERRYFELGYRLRVAAEALARLDERRAGLPTDAAATAAQ